MDLRTKIEKEVDWNSGANLGWGEPDDPPNHRLMKERRLREKEEDAGTFADLAESLRFAREEESPMEKLCREKFQFDSGWSFHAAEELLYGSSLVHSQGNVGSCVGAGGGLALAAKAAQEILNEGDPEDPAGWETEDANNQRDHAMPFTGYHYGAGRCKNLWNGSKFQGSQNRGDGSYCSVQIWAYKTTGIVPCRMVKESYRGPFPQSSDVRSWGNNKRGELNDHLDIGQQYLMQNSVTVKSGDDIKRVITELKQPCHICSTWGFAPKGIDSKYDMMIYRPSGTWAHNMTIFGVFEIKGQWFVLVKNSWGRQAHKKIGRGFPMGCFVIPMETFDRWVRAAEVMSIGELTLPDTIPSFVR